MDWAFEAAYKEAQRLTEHTMPTLCEIINAFMEQQDALTELALKHFQDKRKEERQEEHRAAILALSKQNSHRNVLEQVV